jgi:hypothetical protein
MSKEEHYIWVKPLYGKTEKEMKENIKRLEKENDKILDEICQDYINLQSQLDIANKKLDKINKITPLELAKTFHLLYESFAPSFGYETREETREFDENSNNGKLMIAVCEKILSIIGDE